MPEVPVQIGGRLSPLTFYDAPLTIMTQVWDGEFSPSIAARTFTSPASLTPSERDNLADRLAKAAGDSSVARAAAGVLTNPWAWFLFLTSPVGERPVANLFQMASKFSLYAMENAPLLGSVGALTSQQALFGSRAGRAMAAFQKGREELMASKQFLDFSDEMSNVLKSNGLTQHGLEWEKYAAGSVERQTAKEISYALHLSRAGWGRDKQVFRTVLNEQGLPELREITENKLVAIDPRSVLNKYGAGVLDDKLADLFKHTGKTVFADPKAVTRIWSNMPTGVAGESLTAKEVTGRAMVKDVMGDLAEKLKAGSITEQQFYDHLQATTINPILKDSNYMPLNVTQTLHKGKVVSAETYADARWAAAMRAGSNTTPRAIDPVMFHPDDLEEIGNLFGQTDALREKINQAKTVYDISLKGDRAVRFHRINPIQSVSKHMDSMSRTYAMFVQDIGDGVREIDRELVGKLKPWNALDVEGASHRAGFSGKAAGLDKTFSEIVGTEMEPRGGVTIADVLYADHGVAQNWWQRDTIGKIVIPRMMGRVGTQSVAKLAMVTKAKELTEAFLSTKAAEAINGSGSFGAKFVQNLREFATSTDEAFEEGERLQRFVTSALYSGALGYNVPSAIINMTQPFGLAGSWVGYNNVLKGYATAFKELGEYVSKRASQGFKPISAYERGQLLRETHQFVNHGGEDLLEIAGDTLANFEGNIYKSLVSEHTVKSRLSRMAFEYPMSMFKYAELLNRNVAAHATNFRNMELAASGVGISAASATENIRTVVRETQFGSHWMNTPQMFMPESASMGKRGFPTGRWFANPLTRQFLTFPMRSFTAWTYTAPRIAGREGMASLRGWINDTARATAVSSMGYEMVKGLTGADISRAGFVAGATDIIPGLSQGQFDERDTGAPFPMPPVIDIPLDTIKSFITDDAELFGRTVSRLIPGGVALSRVLSSSPKLEPMRYVGQSRYADWKSMTSSGQVPVFDSTGNLIDLRSPARLILEGLGVDMGAFKDENQMMQYLLKQRDQIVDYRRQYMTQVYGGQIDKAEMLAQEFQKRFKVPLTVTKGQWQEFSARRNTPRVERQLDRMPEDVREQYTRIVGNTIPESDFGLQTGQLIAATKSSERTREEAYRIDPKVAAYIRQQLAKSQATGQRRAQDSDGRDWGPFKASDFQPQDSQ